MAAFDRIKPARGTTAEIEATKALLEDYEVAIDTDNETLKYKLTDSMIPLRVENAYNADNADKLGNETPDKFLRSYSGSNKTPIEYYTGNSTGDGIRIGAGGSTVIGAGEYTDAKAAEIVNWNDENLYIGSDGPIFFHSNANTYADKKTMELQATGILRNDNGFYCGGTYENYFAKLKTASIAFGNNDYLTYDDGTNTYKFDADGGGNCGLHVYANDSYLPTIAAYGDSQGSGRVYVGQSSTTGGGIEYDGDGTPVMSGAGSDYVALFRRASSVDYWTARNKYSSADWEFRGQVTAFSDRRVKDNIADKDIYEELTNIPVREFNRNDDNGRYEIGVIAQEVEAVLPSFVKTGEDDYKSVNYASLGTVAGLTAIKEIEELKKEIAELKAIIKELV